VFTKVNYLSPPLTRSIQSATYLPTEVLFSYSPLIYTDVFQVISFFQSFSIKPLNAFLFSRMCVIRPPWLYQSNNIWRIIQITKLVITQFLTVSCYFLHFGPNDLPHNSILVHPQPIKIKLFYDEAAVITNNPRSHNNFSSNEIVTISYFLSFCYSVQW